MHRPKTTFRIDDGKVEMNTICEGCGDDTSIAFPLEHLGVLAASLQEACRLVGVPIPTPTVQRLDGKTRPDQ